MENKMFKKFKTGDRVRVVDDSGAPSRCEIGDICQVVSTTYDKYAGYLVDVTNERTGGTFKMYQHRFSLVTEKSVVTYRLIGPDNNIFGNYKFEEEAVTQGKSLSLYDNDKTYLVQEVSLVTTEVAKDIAKISTPSPKSVVNYIL